MNESPAILITYHNEGQLLRRCLLALAAQTRPVREVLIYDDASSVRPDEFLVPGLPIRVIRGDENIGPARGRNMLLAQTRAEFVHFHDADDAFEPEWHERVSAELESGDVDAVFTEVGSVTASGFVREDILELRELAAGGDLIRFCVRGAMLVPAGTYRRSLIQKLSGYRESLWQSEDWDFHIRLACAGPRYRVIPASLVRIYLRAESRSRDQVQVWDSAVQAIASLAEEVPVEYLADLSEAAARAGKQLFRAGATARARAAFALAEQLGQPAHAGEARVYRTLARHAGQEWAERVGSAYRRWLPERMRGRLGRGRS